MAQPQYSLTVHYLEIERAFRAFPALMVRKSHRTLGKEGQKGLAQLKREHLTGGTSDDRLAVRTGNLRRSFWTVVVGTTLNDLALVLTSDSPYARIHEEGGTVKAKAGGMLAIPLRGATTASGVAKWPSPRSPGAPPMHLLVLGGKNTSSGKGLVLLVHSISGEPLYLLKKSVHIKARLHAEDTMRERLPLMVTALGRAAVQAWEDA